VVPIATFPRVFFPIQWLLGCMPRVFSAHRRDIIPSTAGVEVVMIAKIEGEKNMVVLERVGESVYSMCMLKKDLKVKDVRSVSKSAKETDMTNLARGNEEVMEADGDEWWRKMTVNNLRRGDENQVSLKFLIDTLESDP
jgi:hypothetical protein